MLSVLSKKIKLQIVQQTKVVTKKASKIKEKNCANTQKQKNISSVSLNRYLSNKKLRFDESEHHKRVPVCEAKKES